MSHIIEAAHREFVTEHSYHFDSLVNPGSGFSFDATDTGLLTITTPAQARSLVHAREEVEAGRMKEVGHRSWTRSYWVEATLRCDCGAEIGLYDPLYNECNCGRGYNGSGQSLAPVSQWEHDDQYAVFSPRNSQEDY